MRRKLNDLEIQLAEFLKESRKDTTYAAFSRKLGIPASTLHRIENGNQSASLNLVHQVMKRLDVKLSDIFKNT